jgi:SsrA-binding protein
MAGTGSVKPIAENRRARHEYHFLERVEAGLALVGSEVKSLRQGQATLQRAYADARDGELWLVGLHIPAYKQASTDPPDPDRDRKLLLHRREIDRLSARAAERGLTIVPTRLYFKDGRAKVELALARGKELRDKRRDIADRETKRRLERELKSRR